MDKQRVDVQLDQPVRMGLHEITQRHHRANQRAHITASRPAIPGQQRPYPQAFQRRSNVSLSVRKQQDFAVGQNLGQNPARAQDHMQPQRRILRNAKDHLDHRLIGHRLDQHGTGNVEQGTRRRSNRVQIIRAQPQPDAAQLRFMRKIAQNLHRAARPGVAKVNHCRDRLFNACAGSMLWHRNPKRPQPCFCCRFIQHGAGTGRPPPGQNLHGQHGCVRQCPAMPANLRCARNGLQMLV